MALHFTKMHGLGNDFMVIDAINQSVNPQKAQIKAWANRHTGIGFDQCLLVEQSDDAAIDFNYRIFNASGDEVNQCGNGARCLARFVAEKGLSDKRTIQIATKTTRMTLTHHDDKTVTVTFPTPIFQPAALPMKAQAEAAVYALPLNNGDTHLVHAVSVGNPHVITVRETFSDVDVATLGSEISTHSYFPEACNAGFMQILAPDHIVLRVYERGAGETLACGSGAVAAVAVGCRYHDLDDRVIVDLLGGRLVVEWPDAKGAITLLGEAVLVYDGILPE